MVFLKVFFLCTALHLRNVAYFFFPVQLLNFLLETKEVVWNEEERRASFFSLVSLNKVTRFGTYLYQYHGSHCKHIMATLCDILLELWSEAKQQKLIYTQCKQWQQKYVQIKDVASIWPLLHLKGWTFFFCLPRIKFSSFSNRFKYSTNKHTGLW